MTPGFDIRWVTSPPCSYTPWMASFTAVKDAIQGVYEQGGEVTHLMSNPGVIGALSTYMFDNEARVATLTSDQGAPANSKATALSSVNVLVSDFGTIKLDGAEV